MQITFIYIFKKYYLQLKLKIDSKSELNKYHTKSFVDGEKIFVI